ncbi:MAG: hypothetical protein JOZ78_23800 [Chroococcidiopsidaceae cyanobacterium CP_BM_ER_R8_30]|nr:hypothetical protein [Chroococcidiopsidaceae cyanobacterium CP_BM_ER_R8_30]
MAACPSHHDTGIDHEHEEAIASTHIVLPRSFDPESLKDRLQILAQQQEIYRIKRFVAVPNKSTRLV